MSRLIARFCGCNKKRQNTVETQTQTQTSQQNRVEVEQTQTNFVIQRSENEISNVVVQEVEATSSTKSKTNLVSITTKFYPSDVDIINETPEKDNVYKYNCPICMKFLSNMLISQCCQNYVCVFCAIEISKHFTSVKCPHCNRKGLVLKDVKPTDQIKKYVDSPVKCLDFKSESSSKISP